MQKKAYLSGKMTEERKKLLEQLPLEEVGNYSSEKKWLKIYEDTKIHYQSMEIF